MIIESATQCKAFDLKASTFSARCKGVLPVRISLLWVVTLGLVGCSHSTKAGPLPEKDFVLDTGALSSLAHHAAIPSRHLRETAYEIWADDAIIANAHMVLRYEYPPTKVPQSAQSINCVSLDLRLPISAPGDEVGQQFIQRVCGHLGENPAAINRAYAANLSEPANTTPPIAIASVIAAVRVAHYEERAANFLSISFCRRDVYERTYGPVE
jgi:hypothetical protein